MSGGVRLGVASAVATLAAACALLPLVDTPTWVLQAAILLALQAAVGVLARRVPLGRATTVVVQALVSFVLLSLVFARSDALGGALPGPDVFQRLGTLLQDGAGDVGRYAIPAPATTGIRLMLVGGVLAVGLAVDALAVTFRSAAPAGLPLLALYSIAAGLAQSGKDWLWFLVAAAGYLLLLLAEGRDRLSGWGRVFGGGAVEDPGAAGRGASPVRTGRRIGAVVLGIALLVPAVLPTMEGGLLERTRTAGTGRDDSTGFDAVRPLVTLQNSLNQPENRELLRYRTSAGNPRDVYLRIVTLDRFDGAAWQPSERRFTDLPEMLPVPTGLDPRVRTESVNTSVAAASTYAQSYLPLPYPAERVRVDGGRWLYEPEGRTVSGARKQTTRSVRYQVSSLLVEPTAAQLAAAPAPREEVLREYTKVPGAVPRVVEETARKVTAGAANAYEQAVKLQDWFAADGGFRYDTQVASGSGKDAIAKFLEEKKGFCIHFSFSMAAMARTLGIPARVAVGFAPGTPLEDGAVSVGSKDAHAWPELYFEGIGWTRFEPTPSRGTAPDYTVTQEPGASELVVPAPAPDRSTAPSARPAAPGACTPQLRKSGECPSEERPTVEAGAHGGGLSTGPVMGAVALGLAVLALPLLLPLRRRRLRKQRLSEARTNALAAWAELTDSAWDYGIAPDESLTPRGAATRLVRLGGLTGPASDAAHRVATAVEQTLYAERPGPAEGLASDVACVRDALRASAGFGARGRALLLPRSVTSRWARAFLTARQRLRLRFAR
ncbi:transglutaminase [Streptomyces griseocarneus]|nr:transglutaminase [Streptomyces griseocarneus]